MLESLRRWAGRMLSTLYPGRVVSESSGSWWAPPKSAAGVAVDEVSALSLSGVFAAATLLSRVIGALPLSVYRKDGRTRVEATTNPAYRALKLAPNPEMTPSTFRRTMEFHRLLWGANYAEIVWNGGGGTKELWPVEPWRVRPMRDDAGSLFYRVDGERDIHPDDMVSTHLVSFDGVCGRSFIPYALESLGMGIAAQEFAASFFGNGARAGAILKHPGPQTPEQRKQVREDWNNRHQGSAKAGRTGVLWGGWEYIPDGSVDPTKAQLLEQRRFTIEEVARWFNIPPHLLRDLSRATFSNIEHQGIDFVTYTLLPTLVGYEEEYQRKLLGADVYVKHNLNGLLRGDSAARSAYYRSMWGIGVMSANDILALEDMDPVEGGDDYYVPVNMRRVGDPEPAAPAPTGAIADGTGDQGDGTQDGQGDGTQGGGGYDGTGEPAVPGAADMAIRALTHSVLRRMARVEGNALRRAAAKPGRFTAWVDEHYAAYESTLAEALAEVDAVASTLTGLPSSLAGVTASRWVSESRAELDALAGSCTAATLAAGAEEAASRWESTRPVSVAYRTVTEVGV